MTALQTIAAGFQVSTCIGRHSSAILGTVQEIRLGRQNLNLGYGTVASVGKNWDGINLINKQGNSTWSAGYFIRSDWRHRRYFFLSNTTQLTPDLEIKTAYFKDSKSRIADTSAKNNGESLYNVVSFGGQYKFHAPFTLKAEFAHNKGNSVYPASNGYHIQLNYRETNLAKRGTWTTWLQYRNMDTGFNPMGFSELKEPIKMSTDATINSAAEGVHGFEYGFSYVPLKNMLSTLKLWSLHHYDVQRSQFGTALQFEYLWR